MKKVILLLIVAIFISFAFSFKINKTKTPPSIIYKTLNGVDQASADTMIRNFQATMTTDTRPVILNFFLSKDMLVKIVKLLDDECLAEGNAVHKTDGVRIYLAKKTRTSPITLLLVSTIDSTITDSNKWCKHHDYYAHSLKEDLYRYAPLPIISCDKLGNCPGAELYHSCGCPDDTSCYFPDHPHYLRRSVAEAMVQACHDHALTTKAEWFDKDMLKALSKDSKCQGIRIYFATHPKNDPITIDENMDALVITTTHKDLIDTTIYRDYFDCKTLQSYFETSLKLHPNWYLHPLSPGQDNGELCPNNCD
jgi:hypothetical protein